MRSPSRRRPRRTPPASASDEELWRVAALLHDFDYEMHPTLDKHPQDGAPILREEGYPEEVIDDRPLAREPPRAAARHAAEEGALRLRRAVRASSTPAGSSARPASRGSSRSRCKKKLKQPSFAAGVSRDDVYEGAELLERRARRAHRERRRRAAADRRRARPASARRSSPSTRRSRSLSSFHQPTDARSSRCAAARARGRPARRARRPSRPGRRAGGTRRACSGPAR